MRQHDTIIILDFGSQYSQLIARRVREAGVYCEIYRHDVAYEAIKSLKPKGIILSGGPESVTQVASPVIPQWVFDAGLPILGICYGMQAMAKQLGGHVEKSAISEFGHARVEVLNASILFDGLSETLEKTAALKVWMSHGDHVVTVPDNFVVLAKTADVPVVAMACAEKQWYGLQFHPEVTHTQYGEVMLARFVIDICGAKNDWTLDNIIEESVQKIHQQVGEDRVILALSGGVDSSVASMLLHKAIGQNLTCIFVDTGLLRFQEADQVMETFAKHLSLNVIKVDAKSRFFDALKGVTDPEAKRKVCGRLFIEIFEEEALKLKGIRWLAQGTIYPDVIESAGNSTQTAHVIKSHHNVGGLPEGMSLKLVEPLRDLFKDEVRQIGVKLGLPYEMLYRHPFPGPGLVVRVLGEVKPEFVDTLQKADHIFIEALRAHGLYDKVSQAFAVFLPVKSVAVKGDARAYEYVIALRAVETIDFMTATWAPLPHDFLAEVSNRICNSLASVSRVVYDVTGKPPGTIEWE